MKKFTHGFITESGEIINDYQDFISFVNSNDKTILSRREVLSYAILLGALEGKDKSSLDFLEHMDNILRSLQQVAPDGIDTINRYRLLISLYMTRDVKDIIDRISIEVDNEGNR